MFSSKSIQMIIYSDTEGCFFSLKVCQEYEQEPFIDVRREKFAMSEVSTLASLVKSPHECWFEGTFGSPNSRYVKVL